ncbi:MAG: DUF1957 domain-containing protein [Chloroflexi bacterium]|nr:DUF1957 domain-containing protein [Chloroflexota bacterium]
MPSNKKGAFTFVLHSHLPYARQAGRWPHGEEWIHEAASETYLPLLIALHDLRDAGVPYRLTVGITPVLAEQLADATILQHLRAYLADKQERAERDEQRFAVESNRHLAYLARWYCDFYLRQLDALERRFGGDMIGAFRELQEAGCLEIATSAATHGYLPLMERDSTIHGQLRVGVESYRRHFGRSPTAIWLPEAAYRPAFEAEADGRRYLKPGLERFLAELGLQVFFAETHTVAGGRPVGKAAGGVLGPYGEVERRYVVPLADYVEPTQKTTYQPYWVAGAEVAVLGRNERTGMQVWSADWGYPGEYDYREFHKKDGLSGLQYWRVTGARVDLGEKDYYHPDWAAYKMRAHADHFASLVEELVQAYQTESGKYGIICAAYDTELFGHWWFEGVDWLREVLRRLSQSEAVELTTASRFIQAHPPEDVLVLPESSWGAGGGHFTWLNVDTEWLWPPIHEAERAMERLVERYPDASGDALEVLQQAARELLLLESSDWPFLITTGQAREYAISRFNDHLERFHSLRGQLESADTNPALARSLFERDNLFPTLDYRAFRRREP